MIGATRPLLPLAAVTAGLASGSSLAAEWTFAPSANFLTQAQKNPTLAVDEKSRDDVSAGLGTTLGLIVQRRTELTRLSLSPVIRAYRYSGDSNLDRNEGQVDLAYDWQGEQVSWSAGAGAARDTTLTSELGTTGLTQGNLRHQSWNVSVGPTLDLSERWQLQSNVGMNASRYPDQQNSLSNYRYSTALISTSYVASETLVLSLYGTAGRLDGEGNRQNTDNKSANIQLRYTWSPLTQFGVSIGRSWVTSNGGRQQGLLYNVTASHAFENGSLALSVSRRQAPSGLALLTESNEARLTFATQITERLSASASASYSKRRNVLRIFDIDLERVTYTRADLGLSWLIKPNWKLGLNAGRATQQAESVFVAGDQTGRGLEVSLGVSWNGDPYVR